MGIQVKTITPEAALRALAEGDEATTLYSAAEIAVMRAAADEIAMLRALLLPHWRTDLGEMPKAGRFEALRIYEVFRHVPEETRVIHPQTGRMFTPVAWRARPTGRNG